MIHLSFPHEDHDSACAEYCDLLVQFASWCKPNLSPVTVLLASGPRQNKREQQRGKDEPVDRYREKNQPSFV